MSRPWKVRNVRTRRTRSFGSGNAALNHVAIIGMLPAHLRQDFVFIDDDGSAWPVEPLLKTMTTISRIYDISTRFVHHATMLKSEPVATSPSMSPDNAQTSASSLSGDDSPGSPV